MSAIPFNDWLERKWQSRKWRGFVGVELALLMVAAALLATAEAPADRLAVLSTWADFAFKVFCAYIVGNVGAIVASGFQITAKEKQHGNPPVP